MKEPKMCCNCLHCARWRKKDGIECHCDLTDKYLGYLDVMDEDNDCEHWEKETKWENQRKHDAEIRAKAIDEFANALINGGLDLYADEIRDIREIAEQLKGGAE